MANPTRVWVSGATIIALAFAASARAEEGPKKIVAVEGITEYQLANGLRVLLYPDASRSKVTVNMTVLVGSRHEGYGETGMAHLLEHMVFKGTPTHANIPKALQDHGAQFNGSTTIDRTNYFETLSAGDENLEFAVRMEADRLVNSTIKKEDLESEFTVVRNEFESGENSPSGVLSKRIFAAAFEWHNYGKSTIGNRSDIERVPVENLRAFYRKFYQPDNVVLVVAGKFDETNALAVVQKYFGAIPRPERKLENTYTEEPAQDGERQVTLRRVGDVGVVGVAYHVPSGPHPDSAALQVLANIFSTQPSGRLYRALVETKKATSVAAGSRGAHDPGLMTLQATVRDANTLDEVRDVILNIAEQAGVSSMSDEELNRAKQQILKQRELAAADTNQIAISLSEWAAQGDWRLYFLNRDRVEAVRAEDVKAVAQKYLLRSNRTIGMFIPTEKPERVAVPATPDIHSLLANYKGRAAVAAGEAFDPTPANVEARVERLSVPEGVKVTLLPKKTRGEEVHLSLTLRYGDEQNLRGYESVGGFLGELMLRGTKSMTYQQLRDELDRLHATLGSGGGGGGGRGGRGRGGPPTAGATGSVSFSIQAKRDTLPAVLQILRQVLREPTLPADQFEIMKRERLAGMEQTRTDPAAQATRLAQQLTSPYPKDDIRYVPTIDEAIERVQAVTRDRVVQLYREFLGSQAGEVTIVGDFDPYACLPILKETLAGWTSAKPYTRIATSAPSDLKASQHKLNTPDKANATYASVLVFPMRDDDPDYAALVMANFVYGGGSLSSRLGTRVRQKEGLSYGVGCTISASSHDYRAVMATSAICNPQNIGKVESAIREELERLIRDGITEEELEQAKQGYLQAQMVRRTNDGALMGLLSELSHADRTMQFQADLEKRIQSLTPDQVLAAIRKHIDPKRLVVISAGDFDASGAGGGD
jgi:zinc protease